MKESSSTSSKPKSAKKRTSKNSSRGNANKKPVREDRSKRLLDLVMLLLRARTPVTFREIRDQFSAYQTANIEAGLRAFERDKADLLTLGVPVRYITPDENSAVEDGGYLVELSKYRLPEVHLTPDEISALVLASSVARAVPSVGYARICDLAVRKLAFDYPDPDTPLAWPPERTISGEHEPVLVHFPEGKSAAERLLGEYFSQIEAATRNRKVVTLQYRSASTGDSTERKLDPYGLYYRERSWLVVGYCHLRKDTRSFRLDRIEELKVAPKPKSPDFERPESFDIRSYSARSPWTFSPQAPEEVVLEFHSEALSTANEDFGSDAIREEVDDGKIRIQFMSGNPSFVVSRILSAKGGIHLISGDSCLQYLKSELDAMEEMYR